MKHLFLPLFIAACFAMQANSQCVPDVTLTEPGLYPDSDSLPCVERTAPYAAVIQFKNFEEVDFGGTLVGMNWLRIDSIENLPCGLQWTCNNDDDRTYSSGEVGCIDIWGTTSDAAGQYRLGIWITANLEFIGTITGEAGALDPSFKYFIRVIELGQPVCPPADTAASANNLNASCNTPEPWWASVNDHAAQANEIAVYPNPVATTATLSFESAQTGENVLRIFSLQGELVHTILLPAANGFCTTEIDLSHFSQGVYLVEVNGSVLQKMVVMR